LPDHYEDAVYDGDEDTGLGKPAEAAAAYRQYADLAQRLVNSDPNPQPPGPAAAFATRACSAQPGLLAETPPDASERGQLELSRKALAHLSKN
jgi:hypothetical protein